MPRYLQVTPTFQPISLQDRLKPMEAYVDTYNKLSDDIAKTEGIMDSISSMLDASNPQDKAVIDSFAKYREGFNQIADDINNGNLNAMMNHARELRSTYAKDYAKIPIAYEAKQNAIKNTKLPQNWIGDRPEYHGTTDFIGKTPTYFGMDADDVYKTGKEMLQGISKQVYHDTGWNLPPELYNQYFEKIKEQGVNAQMMNTFMNEVRDGIIASGGTEEDVNKVSNVAVEAIRHALSNIADKYQADKLTTKADMEKFLGAALSGFQAGAAYDTEDKTLGTHIGGYSGGSGGGSGRGGGSSSTVTPTPTPTQDAERKDGNTWPLNFGSNKDTIDAKNRYNDISSPDYVTTQTIDGQTYYVSSSDVSEYNNKVKPVLQELQILDGQSDETRRAYARKLLLKNYTGINAYSRLINAERSAINPSETIGSIVDRIVSTKEGVDKVLNTYVDYAKDNYLHKHDKEMEHYNYLGLDDPLLQARIGSAIEEAQSVKAMWNSARAEDAGNYVENLQETLQTEIKSKQYYKQKGTNVLKITKNGETQNASTSEVDKIADTQNKNVKLLGNSKYGIALQDQDTGALYVPDIDKFKDAREIAGALSKTYDFSDGKTGVKISETDLQSIVNQAKRGSNLFDFDIINNNKKDLLPGHFWVVTFNTGNDVCKIALNYDGTPVMLNKEPFMFFASDYANGKKTPEKLLGKLMANDIIDRIYRGEFNTKKSK